MFTSEWIENKAKELQTKLDELEKGFLFVDKSKTLFEESKFICELFIIYAQSREEARLDNLRQKFKVVQFEK